MSTEKAYPNNHVICGVRSIKDTWLMSQCCTVISVTAMNGHGHLRSPTIFMH